MRLEDQPILRWVDAAWTPTPEQRQAVDRLGAACDGGVLVREVADGSLEVLTQRRGVASPLVVYEPVEVSFRGCRGARAVGERGATAAGPGDS